MRHIVGFLKHAEIEKAGPRDIGEWGTQGHGAAEAETTREAWTTDPSLLSS